MKIRAKIYRKKDGKLMIYLNNDRGVSLGLGERVLTSKFTKGQNNLWDAFFHLFEDVNGLDIMIDPSKHTEEHYQLDFGYHLFITDIAEVAGVKVASDGAYLYRKGKLISLEELNND